MSAGPRFARWSGLAAGMCAGATFGVLMTADAQIIVDPDLPPSMLEGSGFELVDALRQREAELAARAAEVEAAERALAEQREQLVEDLEALGGDTALAAVDTAAQTADAPDEAEPDATTERGAVDETTPTAEELEAARLARLDTLSRRVQAMSPAAAAAMLTAMDAELATEVLSTINARNSGKIMEQLAPNVAARFGAMMVAEEDN